VIADNGPGPIRLDHAQREPPLFIGMANGACSRRPRRIFAAPRLKSDVSPRKWLAIERNAPGDRDDVALTAGGNRQAGNYCQLSGSL